MYSLTSPSCFFLAKHILSILNISFPLICWFLFQLVLLSFYIIKTTYRCLSFTFIFLTKHYVLNSFSLFFYHSYSLHLLSLLFHFSSSLSFNFHSLSLSPCRPLQPSSSLHVRILSPSQPAFILLPCNPPPP